MNKKRNKILIMTLFVVAILSCLMISANALCGHTEVNGEVIARATCTKDGTTNLVCLNCDRIVDTITEKAIGHNFGDYKIENKPKLKEPGLMIRYCENCHISETMEYECKHENKISKIKPATCAFIGREATQCVDCESILNTNVIKQKEHKTLISEVLKNPTCTEPGVQHQICKDCETEISVSEVDVIDCTYGDWEYVKIATPGESGLRSRYCSMCGDEQSEQYEFSMAGSNSIYVQGTGIDHRLTVTTLTQSSVDSYDMVLDYDYYGSVGTWILGHRYGTLSRLSNIGVGQIIYISVGGNIQRYQVTVSEHAMQNANKTDIIGTYSGISVLSSPYGYDTLHMYTCYGSGNERWIVLAKRI